MAGSPAGATRRTGRPVASRASTRFRWQGHRRGSSLAATPAAPRSALPSIVGANASSGNHHLSTPANPARCPFHEDEMTPLLLCLLTAAPAHAPALASPGLTSPNLPEKMSGFLSD